MRKVYLFVILLFSTYAANAAVFNLPTCSGLPVTLTNVNFGEPGGTLYSWLDPSPAGITGSSAGVLSANFSQTLINTTNAPIVVTYTVGTSILTSHTVNITVYPVPTVNAIANQAAVCAGTLTTLVNFTGLVAGTTYDWTNTSASIGLPTSGSGSITPFTAANAGNVPFSVNITVTPMSNTCFGSPQSFSMTVNPIPNVNLPLDEILCTGAATTAVTFTSTVASTVFNWTNNNAGIGLATGPATGNIASFTTTNVSNLPITGFIQVTPVSNTCSGSTITYSITVKPLPTVNAVGPQAICNGTLTTAVNFTGSVANSSYSWTNSSSTIGLAFPTGSGSIAAFTAANLSNIPLSAIITVTPSSNTCNGTPLTFTITVNPTPDITGGITDLAFCNGVGTSAVTFSSSVANADYAWTSTATSIGIAAAGSGTINSFAATNPTSAAATAIITVAPFSNTCIGSSYNFSITVNPTPDVLNGITDQVVCNGSLTNIVTFTGSVTGTTFSWVNNTTSIGLTNPGTGTINAFTAINSSTTPIVASISVLPISNTCIGTLQTFSITVNPTPIVNTIADLSVCNTGSSAPVSITGSVAGALYTWSNTNTGVGLGASGIGDILPFSGTNGTNIATTALVIVTTMSNSCYGATTSFTVTVNPTPTVNIIADQAVCNNTPTLLVNITGSVAGTVYNWINDNATIGLLGTGAGNISAFTTTNLSNAPVFGNITVTPVANTCLGSPYTFSITVNPTPSVNTVSAQSICNGLSTATIPLTGSITTAVFNWTNNNALVGLASSGIGDIAPFTGTNSTNAPTTAIVTVTPMSNSCPGSPISFTVTVNPTPTLVAIGDQTACAGFTTTAGFTGAVTGTTFNWTNDNTLIGLPATGSGNISAFSLTNISNGPITGIIVVTPTANTCLGVSQTFSITVNPTPTVNAIGDQVLCNGTSTTLVTFSGYVPSTTYNWINTAGGIGLAASASGDIVSFSATNATTVPVTGLITVTPVSNACSGTPITFSITVNPTPGINAVANAAFCNGALAAVTFSGSVVTNTVYNWTNGNTTIGLTSTGSGSSLSFTVTNLSNAPVAAALTVTPMSNTCNGITQSFSIVVNPTPAINPIADQPICNGTLTAAVTFVGNIPTAVYAWSNTNTAIGLAASATTISIAAFTGTNPGNLPISGVITVIPVSNACTGAPTSFSITVNPTPVVNAMSSTAACNGVLTAFTFTGSSVGGTNYSWTNDDISIGIGASGSGNISTFTATNTGTVPVYASIVVTPISNTCGGVAQGFSFVVNPTPTVTPSITTQVLCNGFTTTAVNFISPYVPSTVYNWTNTNINIGLAASSAGGIASFTATNTVLVPISGMITVTPISNSCNGSPVSFTITVNPTPTVNALTSTSICNGVLTSFSFTGSAIANTTYNWTNTNTQVNIAASGSGDISSFTATNIVSPAPITAMLTVTPLSNACSGTPQSFTLTVNPTPTVNAVGGPFVLCTGGVTTAITFTGTVASTNYNWVNTNAATGLTALSSTGNIAPFVTTNTLPVPINSSVTVTPVSNTCAGSSISFSFIVNPVPTVNTIADQSICNTFSTTAVTFTGFVANTTYTWTNTNAAIGFSPLSGTGTINAFTGTNPGGTPINTLITVSPFSNTCTGTPVAFSVIVNPTPSVNAVGGPFVLCVGGVTTAITFTGSVAATNYNWTNTNTATGLSAFSSTGNIAPFTSTNAFPVPINSSVIVTPVSNTCSGAPIAFSIIVNPIPTVNTIASQSICNAFSTATVTFSGFVAGTDYTWTQTNTSLGLAPFSGTGTINAFTGINASGIPVNTVITVSPFSNTCTGTSVAFSIVVNPTPTVNTVGGPFVLCTGGVTTAITFTGNVASANYNWTNTSTATGLSAISSTGNIAAFTTTNAFAVPISSSVTVTPVSNACSGSAIAFSFVVNPIPTVNTIASQAICNTLSTAAVTFSGFVPNTIYTWSQTNTSLGLTPFSGTGTINAFTGINASTLPVNTMITVSPFSNTCTGTSIAFSIVVNPTPTVSSLTASSQVLCNGVLTALVTPVAGATNVPGTIYNWNSSITTIGISTGSGPVNPFTATNTGSVPVSALVTVTPVSNSCSGTPTNYTLTINPTPSVNTVADVAICNGFTATVAAFTGSPVASTRYDWLLTGSPVGITSASPGSIIPFIGTNTTPLPISAIITVTPVSNTCSGTPIAFTITVNPTPVLNSSLTSTVCNGTAFSYSATTLTPNTSFAWNRAANTAINGNTSNSGIGTITESLISNSTTTAVNAVYAFTLTANTCINSQNVTVTINPDAVLTSTLTPGPICAATIFSYSPSFSAPGASLTWTRTLPAGLSSGGPASGTGSVAQTINNSTTAPGIATYAYTVAVSSCINPTPFNVTLTVNPVPVLNSATTFAPICSGTNFSYLATSATVGATFSWNKPSVTGITTAAPLTGTINPVFHVFNNNNATLTNVLYTYTISANACVNQQTVTIGVYPVGSLNSTLVPAPVCSNTVFSYSPTSITGGITFNWSRPIVAGITNTAGSGINDPAEILFNNTTGPINVIYNYNIITAAGCTNAQTVVATINPRPTLSSSLTPAAICTGALFNYVPTSGTVSTTFNWSRPAVTGVSNGAATGFNNPAEVLTNPTINPVAVVYNFTLTANSCVNNQPVTVFVNPIPIVGAQSATICSNSTFTVTPANVPAATLYTWGAPAVTPVGSTLGANLQSTGVTPISQFLNNQTVNATTVIYYVVPTASGCNGNTFTVTITVNPTPVVGAQTMTAVCSGTPFNFAATGVPAGTSYTWAAPATVPSGSLTGGTSQPLTQPSVSQTLVSTNNLMDTAIYSVTPATVLCIGNPFLLTVPVKPVPVISNLRDTICSGNTFVLNPTPVPANTTFTWTAPAVSPSGAITGGSAQTVPTTGISQTLINNSTAYAQATYTVTPSALNCAGAPFLLIETVNRAIPVFAAQNALICSGTAFNATPSNTPAGTTFTWPVPANSPPVGITGTSAALLPVTTVSQVLSNNNNAIDTAIYTVTPSINNCPGIAFAANIRVMPLPKATISGPANICANVPVDTVSLAFNGTAPWTFTFSDGITTNTRTGITSSPYRLTLPAMAKNISKRLITVMDVKDATCTNTVDSSFFTQIINPLPVGKIISLHGNYLCNGIKDTLFVQSPDSLGYQWKLNTVDIPGATTDSIATTSAGSYNAMLTNAFGCSDSAALPVTLYLIKPPVLKLSIDTSCINSITTFKNLTDTTFTGPVQWLWNFGNGKTATAMDGVTTYPAAGNYHVSLKATQLSCTAYAPVTLDTTVNIQFPIPGITLPSVSASKGTPTPVDSRSIPGYKYQWTPSAGIQTPDSPSTVFNFSTTQQYIIKLISQAGCVTNDTLLVRVFDADVKEIFVPKTFTPNGDGVNDKLYPYIAGVKQFHYFRILNRFGKLLFETKTPDNGWDGTLNGVQQPMSIYFWFAEGVLEDGTVVQKSGQVLLIR